MKNFKISKFGNSIVFLTLIILSLILIFFLPEQRTLQWILIAATFICAGFFVKRPTFYTFIAVMIYLIFSSTVKYCEIASEEGNIFCKIFGLMISEKSKEESK